MLGTAVCKHQMIKKKHRPRCNYFQIGVNQYVCENKAPFFFIQHSFEYIVSIIVANTSISLLILLKPRHQATVVLGLFVPKVLPLSQDCMNIRSKQLESPSIYFGVSNRTLRCRSPFFFFIVLFKLNHNVHVLC